MENLSKIKNRSDEEIFSFWNNLGFLNGLNDKDAKNVAKLMEDMAVYLLDSEGKYKLQVIETIVFPMIRRAYRGGISDKYTPERMCDLIEHTFVPFTNSLKTWGDDVDIEAEYCAAFSSVFSNFVKL